MNYNHSTISTSSVDDVLIVIDEHRERIIEKYHIEANLAAWFDLTKTRDGIWVDARYSASSDDNLNASVTETHLAHCSLLDPYYHRLREIFQYVSQVRILFSSSGDFSEVIQLRHAHNEFLKDMPKRWTYHPWDAMWNTPMGHLDLSPESRFIFPPNSPGTVIPIGEGYDEHFERLIRTNMAIIDSAAQTADFRARKASIINFNCPDTDDWILDLCPEESLIYPKEGSQVINQSIAKFMEYFETSLHDLWRPLKMEIEDCQC